MTKIIARLIGERTQAHMHQNLLSAEFASVEYLNTENKNMHVLGGMKALTKELHICLPSITFLVELNIP